MRPYTKRQRRRDREPTEEEKRWKRKEDGDEEAQDARKEKIEMQSKGEKRRWEEGRGERAAEKERQWHLGFERGEGVSGLGERKERERDEQRDEERER